MQHHQPQSGNLLNVLSVFQPDWVIVNQIRYPVGFVLFFFFFILFFWYSRTCFPCRLLVGWCTYFILNISSFQLLNICMCIVIFPVWFVIWSLSLDNLCFWDVLINSSYTHFFMFCYCGDWSRLLHFLTYLNETVFYPVMTH